MSHHRATVAAFVREQVDEAGDVVCSAMRDRIEQACLHEEMSLRAAVEAQGVPFDVCHGADPGHLADFWHEFFKVPTIEC